MSNRLHVITGGAGFIGISLARLLLDRGDNILIVDNLSRGKLAFVESLGHPNRIVFRKADVSDAGSLSAALDGFGQDDVEVWHLCANSDIPAGVSDPSVDLKDTFLVTYELLRAMRERGWKHLHFASTSAVYGDHGLEELTEKTFVEPISNYGAMKLASEAAIRAAAESQLTTANVFRFPNVVGVPATHGVLLDFVQKLKGEPGLLPVLGDGTQRKAYLHVSGLVDAMVFIRDRMSSGYNVFNIGPQDEGITVAEIAKLVCATVSPNAEIVFGSESRGWVGDVPRFRYNVSKLAQLGWVATQTSHDAICLAINEIALQEGASASSKHA